MKISKKRLLPLAIIILMGLQPITNYASENSSKTASLTSIAAAAINTVLGYIASIMEYKYIRPWTEKKITKTVEKFTGGTPQAKKTITFKDYIGVPQEAITLVDQLKHPEKYEAMSISIPHGILLTGDPGVGKTYLAQAIAGEVDCPFFEHSATDFLSKWMGEAEARIRNAFQTARDAAQKAGKSIAIIFIDEFDTIGKRSSGEGKVATMKSSVVNTFLTEMGGFEKGQIPVIVIAATNFPENIDPALRRPGRFDYIIHIPYPNKENRIELLELAAKNKPVAPNVNFDNLAEATEGMSHADIKLLFDLAGNVALQHNNIERDYDSFVKAIWQIKEKNALLKMASREKRKQLIDTYLQKLNITQLSTEDLINQTANMTTTDINEMFERAYKFSQEQPEKTFIDWLWVAIEAKKQQMKIRKNKEAFELCEKVYAPHTIKIWDDIDSYRTEHTQKELLEIEPNDIFNEFNVVFSK